MRKPLRWLSGEHCRPGAERRRAWHPVGQASELVEEPELQAILRAFGSRAAKQRGGSAKATSAKTLKEADGVSRAE